VSASLIFIATLVSRISGFAREIAMAAFFGTSVLTDAWLMASALPNLLFSTINGAISVTVVPLMTQGDAEYSSRSVMRFLNEVFTALFVLSAGLVLVLEIFTPSIIHAMAPGFHSPREIRLTILMTRIMIPTIFFWGVAGLAVGILQEREEFFLPALSPVAVNIARIATIIILGHLLFGIVGVAIGFTLAVISQLTVTLPKLRQMGIRLHFRWHFSHPLMKRMLKISGPFFLTSSVGSVGIIVDRVLASGLVTGSIAALNYSYVLVQIPIGLVISSLATPIYTRLSQHHSARQGDTFRQLAMQGFRLVLLIIVPVTVWFLALRIPILRLLYQHGAFNGQSTDLTSGTLLFFAMGLPGFSLAFYLQRLFFATQDTRSPARFSIITIMINIAGDLVLVHFMQADGLALATGGASWINAALLTWKALNPRYNAHLRIRRTLFSLALAGGVMSVITLLLYHVMHMATVSGIIPLLATLTLTVAISGLVYLLVLLALRFPDLETMRLRLVGGRRRATR
jgi:putative peptidoglycan lipid II flippase